MTATIVNKPLILQSIKKNLDLITIKTSDWIRKAYKCNLQLLFTS